MSQTLEIMKSERNGHVHFAEPKISFIVPVYKIRPMTLKRCIASLLDQDYTNIEIVIVLDGPDEELEKMASEFIQHPQVKLFGIEHSGACAARNAGFNYSTGEIVSFFNSDYMAKPGMVRRWVNALQEHPECGFAYGGYAYATAQEYGYPSKPFDPYLLTVANYIDCGFPLWRKHVVEWDKDCKSLQDWDFWLRVVRGDANSGPHADKHDCLCIPGYMTGNPNRGHNKTCGFREPVKGFYMGAESSFLAEPPRPGGLSEDSSNNWVNRVRYVKSKNGIKEPELLVTSFGAANHGVEIAKMLGADFRDDTLMKPDEYKAVYLIGFYNRGEDMRQHANVISHYKEKKKKVIVHFVGADIYWLRHRTFKDLKYLAGALNLQCDKILSENDQAHKELLEMGIKSEIVPIPPYNKYEVKSLPEEFRCAFFITERSDFDKYCTEETLSIARCMPDIQFSAYGDAADDKLQYPNVKCYGNMSFEKWREFVYSNSCLLRIVRHDTMPLASSEFILAGRSVVTNIPAPFMNVIDTKGTYELNQWDIFQEGLNPYHWSDTKKKIVQEIRKVKNFPGDSSWIHSAHDYYAKLQDRETYMNKIYEMSGIERKVK